MFSLEDTRVRAALFILGAVLLSGLIAWVVMRGDDGSPQNAAEPEVSLSADSSQMSPGGAETSADNPEGPTASDPSSARPSPSDPTSSGSPSESPNPGQESDKADEREERKATKQQVINFVKAFNTFSWQDSDRTIADRAIAAGAVPGSKATEPAIWGDSRVFCLENYCSLEFISAEEAKPDEPNTAMVWVKVRSTWAGVSTVTEMSCEVFFATGADAQRGLFSNISCIGNTG